MTTEVVDPKMAQSSDRAAFEPSALFPVHHPGYGNCDHVFHCADCGPHEVWIHETYVLMREWADTVFQLADTDPVSDDLALSAIRAVAVAMTDKANEMVNGTGAGYILEDPPLKVVSSDHEREG